MLPEKWSVETTQQVALNKLLITLMQSSDKERETRLNELEMTHDVS